MGRRKADKDLIQALLGRESDRCDTQAIADALKRGADPNVRFLTGGRKMITPLFLVAMFGSEEDVRLLVEHGADPNAREYPAGDPTFPGGITPLFWAPLNRGGPGAARGLIAAGADVNAQDNLPYSTYYPDAPTTARPLDVAMNAGNEGVIRELIKAGATCSQQWHEGEFARRIREGQGPSSSRGR